MDYTHEDFNSKQTMDLVLDRYEIIDQFKRSYVFIYLNEYKEWWLYRLNWEVISENLAISNFPIEFFKDFGKFIEWNKTIKNGYIFKNLELLDVIKEYFDWDSFANYYKLCDFLSKDKIIDILCKYKKYLPNRIFTRIKDSISTIEDFNKLKEAGYTDFTSYACEWETEKIWTKDILTNLANNINWEEFIRCMGHRINEEIFVYLIDSNIITKDLINSILYSNINMSCEFIEKYQNYINWDEFSSTYYIRNNIILNKYKEKINWEIASCYFVNLGEYEFDQFSDQIHWELLNTESTNWSFYMVYKYYHLIPMIEDWIHNYIGVPSQLICNINFSDVYDFIYKNPILSGLLFDENIFHLNEEKRELIEMVYRTLYTKKACYIY